MPKIAALSALFALCACSYNNAAAKAKLMPGGVDPDHPLFVGHSTQGEVVVAATHYDAMGGMAVTAKELGQKGNDRMVCGREEPTGTHVPKWICRYQADMDAERSATRDWLDKPRNCLSNCGGPSKTPVVN